MLLGWKIQFYTTLGKLDLTGSPSLPRQVRFAPRVTRTLTPIAVLVMNLGERRIDAGMSGPAGARVNACVAANDVFWRGPLRPRRASGQTPTDRFARRPCARMKR